jgi:hypothetical protein
MVLLLPAMRMLLLALKVHAAVVELHAAKHSVRACELKGCLEGRQGLRVSAVCHQSKC